MATAMASTGQNSFVARNWRDLIRPRNLEVDVESLTPTYGKFTCEPLERGFGTTLGNSLRRILLSSLQGAAITAVKIEGALHEFTTIPDVVEDVTDIVLNLKEVLLKAVDSKPRVLRIEKDGEGRVNAGDIHLSDGIEVLNPDHKILTCSKGAKLRMELTVGSGRGYVPSDRNKGAQIPVGVIPIDSLFSPIRKVNFQVTNARVGQQTDYDRLSLEVWTNGAVKPDDAVAFAAKILKDQLSIFINFEEGTRAGPRLARLRGAGEAEREPLEVGRRAGAVGPLGELPPERQHPLHRRAGSAHRVRDVEDQELRPQVAEGDQRNPRRDGPLPRNEARRLAGRRPAQKSLVRRRPTTDPHEPRPCDTVELEFIFRARPRTARRCFPTWWRRCSPTSASGPRTPRPRRRGGWPSAPSPGRGGSATC